MTTSAARRDLAHELMRVVEGEVRFGQHDRLLYATDASLYQVEPIGVVVPASVEDAERVVRWCGARGVAVLARGGGTSLAGQCVNEAVVVDLSAHCRGIRGLDAPSRRVEAEAGLTIDALNAALASSAEGRGLFFAADPATVAQATVGGCIGNNAAGSRSIVYGRTSENVLGIDAVLATGERLWLGPGAGRADPTARRLASSVAAVVRRHAELIRARYPRTVRRNAGYGLDMILAQLDRGVPEEGLDLTGLLCGSEGTLAVTLAARLRLHPVPTSRGLAVAAFRSVDEAIALVPAILRTGPSAVEMLDDVVLEAARGNIECREYARRLPGLDGKTAADEGAAGAILYIEYSGEPGEVAAGFESARGIVGGAPLALHADSAAMLSAWRLRRAGEPLLHGLPGPRRPVTFVEDNAVPVERLAEFVRRFREIVTRHGTRAAFWAHASVGVLHVRPMIDLHDEADRRRLRAIAVEVADLARECGGVMSGEHGDGRVRGPLLERFYGPELVGAFREVKRVFDPRGVLNPGMVVGTGPVESITVRLRIAPGPVESGPEARPARVPPVETFFTYDDHHGFAGAVEACNGAGLCRRTAGGTMCPSYRALLDERHATRGRANALRLALTGQLGPAHGEPPEGPAWAEPETLRTLDLCLSCKACVSECPSNVDLARLKSEYLAQGYAAAGRVPLAAQAIGRVRWLSRVASWTPGLARWGGDLGPVRALLERMPGLDRRRSLPPVARSLYAQWRGRQRPSGARADGRARVVLFADCFTAYSEPGIGLAAAYALEGAGYDVELLAPEGWTGACCGRSMLSVGMAREAAAEAAGTARTLLAALDGGCAGVAVCEPSCLSAITDDWLKLRMPVDLADRERLAARTATVEEFLDRAWRDGQAAPPAADEGTGRVLLHAHCHQKALRGPESSARALRAVYGARVQTLDTGCCGLAGAWGYAPHRHGLSMRIGELALFPALRGAAPDDIAVAPGTSCRHQVRDGLGRHVPHPVELLASRMGWRDAGGAAQGPGSGR